MSLLIITRSIGGAGGGGGGGDYFDFPLPSANYEPSVITMEIAAPRSGLASTYRYYKAYPGILYEVPIKVLGGAAPFHFELLQAPSGMTIGADLPRNYLTNGPGEYALIRWSNPTTSGSPHTVQVRATDQEGTQVTVTYSLTVTTSGFIFIDSVNGHRSSANGGTGTGTISNPFLGFRDWYAGATGGTGSGTKNDTTYQGYIVYLRDGTYALDDAYIEDGWRLTDTGAKPKTFLGYPGETAQVSFGNYAWNCESGPLFFGNLSFVDLSQDSGQQNNLRYGSSQGDFVIFDCDFASLGTSGISGQNSSALFTVAESVSNYHLMDRVTFQNMNSHDAWLLYRCSKIVADWVTVQGTLSGGNGHGLYFKDSASTASVRFCRAENSGNDSHLIRIDGYNNEQQADNYDLVFNSAKSTSDCVMWGNNGGNLGTTWERRNTWNGGNPARLASNAGILNTARNVIRYNTSPLTAGSMTVNATNNLQATSGLIDSNNLLTGADRTNYLGIRGHEISD